MTKPRESGDGWSPDYIRQSAAAYHQAARQVFSSSFTNSSGEKMKTNIGSAAAANKGSYPYKAVGISSVC